MTAVEMFNTYVKDVKDASAKVTELHVKLHDDSMDEDDFNSVSRESIHADDAHVSACCTLAHFVVSHADEIRSGDVPVDFDSELALEIFNDYVEKVSENPESHYDCRELAHFVIAFTNQVSPEDDTVQPAEGNNGEIIQLLLDAVQEFDSCCTVYDNTGFDSESYGNDLAYREHYDDVLTNFNMSAVTLAFVIRSYKDFLTFPDDTLNICTINGNFNIFFDLFAGALDHLQMIDRQISRYDDADSIEGLYTRFGHAVRNFAHCSYMLACYVSTVIEDVHFKQDT